MKTYVVNTDIAVGRKIMLLSHTFTKQGSHVASLDKFGPVV